MLDSLYKEISVLANPKKAMLLQRFFKTGKGEYGEGDIFLGLTVPQSRSIAKQFKTLPRKDIEKLLAAKFHEYRQIGLMILVLQFQKASLDEQKEIFDFYVSHVKAVNNWDLVDGTAGYIVGEWVYKQKKDRKILERLVKSKNLWEKRIAMIATFSFLYHGDDSQTYVIAENLIKDPHDLIQKAVGWMLREAGKRVSVHNEKTFLGTHYHSMGRTALRYAIEHFPQTLRKQYLHGTI